MRVALIGCGNAGSKVVDQAVAYEDETGRDYITDALVANSATADLQKVESVSQSRKLLIGQSITPGEGAGANNKVGKEIAEEYIDEIMTKFGNFSLHRIDAYVPVTSLGGGTGSALAPTVAAEIKQRYDKPVYGVGILPGRDEPSRYKLNAARSLQTYQDETDNLILFDNSVWREGSTAEQGYRHANHELVKRFTTLFGAGEQDDSEVAENVVDASEIHETLSCGGVSTIGYKREDATTVSKGLLSQYRNGHEEPDMQELEFKIKELIRGATTGQLTVPADITSTTKALCLVSGPQNELHRRGLESGRLWLEENTDCPDVRGGDDPRQQGFIAGLTLLSGVTNCQRVKEIQKKAVEAQDSMQELDNSVDQKTQDLVTDSDNQIDPL